MTLLAQSGSTLVSLTLRFQPMGKDTHREKAGYFRRICVRYFRFSSGVLHNLQIYVVLELGRQQVRPPLIQPKHTTLKSRSQPNHEKRVGKQSVTTVREYAIRR